jgi:predicted O-methyltransferase YrrM
MYLAERKALFEAVMARKPRFCYEIGTASGGGSTFFIASALSRLGSGRLVSLEVDEEASERAARRYAKDLPHLEPFVEFLEAGSPEAFLPFIGDAGSAVEFFFLDGSNHPEEAVAQYRFFRQFARDGTIMAAHDWDDTKMSLLRPLMEKEPSWQLVQALHDPLSVGFVLYRFEGASQ